MKKRSMMVYMSLAVIVLSGVLCMLIPGEKCYAEDTVTWTFKGNGKTITTSSGVPSEELGAVTGEQEVVRTITKGTKTNVMISWFWPSCGDYCATYWKRERDGKLFKHWEELTADQDEVFLAEWHKRCRITYELKKGATSFSEENVFVDPRYHAEGTELLVFETPVRAGAPVPFYLVNVKKPVRVVNQDGTPNEGTGFLGWRVKGSSNGKIYNSLDPFYPEGDTVFEAVFLPQEKGTILYDGDGNIYKITAVDKAVSYEGYLGTGKAVNIPATVTLDTVKYRVTAISPNAFKGNATIRNVTIGKNVTTIGKTAFYGCKNLVSVKIGAKVGTIGNQAFFKCKKLSKITIPGKVSKIGKSAFQGCKMLKTITFKTTKLTAKKVGANAFKGTPKNAKVKVPKKVKAKYKKWLVKKGISKKVKI